MDLSAYPMAGACGTRHQGHCLRLVPRGALVGQQSWRLFVAPEVRDAAGQPVFNEEPPVIVTGAITDRQAPRLLARHVRVADGCAVLVLRLDEDADVRVEPSWSDGEHISVGRSDHEVGVPVAVPLRGYLTVSVSDLAGNRANPFVVTVEAHGPRSVIISEVLSNPAGPEPSQEFVELFNAGLDPVDLTGWRLDDGDDGSGVARLPGATLAPGGFAVLVGSAYSSALVSDPAPAPDALLIRLDSTVGGRGLSNRESRWHCEMLGGSWSHGTRPIGAPTGVPTMAAVLSDGTPEPVACAEIGAPTPRGVPRRGPPRRRVARRASGGDWWYYSCNGT